MVKWIAAALLLYPVAEIAVFVLIVTLTGLGWALALMLATTLAGILLLRRGGLRRDEAFSVVTGGRDGARNEADLRAFLTAVAGMLLLLPGFITDMAGMLLLLPPVRRRTLAAFRRMTERRAPRRHDVIDLDPREWRRMPERGSGEHRKPDDARGP